jgi:hypothetical protein
MTVFDNIMTGRTLKMHTSFVWQLLRGDAAVTLNERVEVVSHAVHDRRAGNRKWSGGCDNNGTKMPSAARRRGERQAGNEGKGRCGYLPFIFRAVGGRH